MTDPKFKKRILDPCCGSKMFWFDPDNPDVEFCDIRVIENEPIWTSADGTETRFITVKPDTVCDVRNLPFPDNTFYHIVFDPPHLVNAGENGWQFKKYGRLDGNWKSFISESFAECMRVLKPNGTLIFKWNETQISVRDILSVIPFKPLYGHKTGKSSKTHWIAFMKDGEE